MCKYFYRHGHVPAYAAVHTVYIFSYTCIYICKHAYSIYAKACAYTHIHMYVDTYAHVCKYTRTCKMCMHM